MKRKGRSRDGKCGRAFRYRSARTGRFVKPHVARRHPNTTVRERV